MLMYALIAIASGIATPPTVVGEERQYDAAAARPTLYSRPAVAPFEPPSNFGRVRAQGDGEADLHRRPLIFPVTVDSYRRSYEYSPSDSEITYEQGVTQARIDAQIRMGELDGVWRVTNTAGDALSDLVVSDAGLEKKGDGIEAAWNIGLASDHGVAVTARREGDAVIIEAGLGARTARLRLTLTAAGWAGALMRNGREQPVVLIRSSEG